MPAFSRTVLLLAPFAHRPGHYGSIPLALADALNAQGVNVRIVPSLPIAADPSTRYDSSSARASGLTKAILTLAGSRSRDGHESRLAKCAEVICVMFRAARAARPLGNVVFHFVDSTFLLLALWVLIFRKPTVYYLPGSMDLLAATAERGSYIGRLGAQLRVCLLRKAAATRRFAIVCETPHMQAAINRVIGNAASVIPYGVSPVGRLPEKAVARQRLEIPPDAMVILLFGTHREGKDYATVFAAAELATPSVFLLFVGAVISDNDPAKLAADRGFTRARFISEFVPEEMVPTYFAAADVVVLPYKGNFTRGSGVLVEACRFNRPLIAADTGYLAEFIGRYGCGLLYEGGNAQSLAGAMNRLAALDNAETARMLTGLQRATTEHSWQTIVPAYLAVYDAVSTQYRPNCPSIQDQSTCLAETSD